MRRLTLGPEDKQVRDWFRNACEAAGLEVHVDALGSMFGLRKGRDMSKPPVGLGSHLDTQPTGGKFDGVLGTLAALEVVRTLNDAGIETETPICIVNWTNEEGSRFAPATMASAAYAGDYTTDDILSRKDAAASASARRSTASAIAAASRSAHASSARFVELHIEQGPLLEAENKTIGVVDRGQGITLVRRQDHRLRKPCRHHADAAAPRRAGGAVGVRAGGRAHRQEAWPERGRHRRRGRDRRAVAQRHPRRGRLHRRCAAARMPKTLDAIDRDLRAAIAEIAARRKVEMTLDRDLAQAADRFNRQARRCRRERRQDARLQPSPHHLGRRPRRLQSRQCGAGGDDLRALQGRRQPQRAGGRHASRLRRRRQCADAYRAGAGRRRVLTTTMKGGQSCAECLSMPTISLAEIFERQRKPGDPDVRINLDPDIKPEQWPTCSTAPRSRSSITRRLPTEVAKQCKGLKHVVFLGTGARSYMNPEELAELGIAVHLIKGYGDTAVAECAIALMWASARGIAADGPRDAAGNWLREDAMQLTGKTLGLIGFGGIAAEVARIALGSGMKVIAWNRTPKSASECRLRRSRNAACREPRGLAASAARTTRPAASCRASGSRR